MTIRNQNVKIYRGNSATLNITVTNAAGAAYSPAVGDLVKYRLSRNPTSLEENAFVLKELGAGITVSAGVASVDLSPDDTDLFPGLYYQELKIIDPPDDEVTAMTGTVVIKPSLRMAVPLMAMGIAVGSPRLIA